MVLWAIDIKVGDHVQYWSIGSGITTSAWDACPKGRTRRVAAVRRRGLMPPRRKVPRSERSEGRADPRILGFPVGVKIHPVRAHGVRCGRNSIQRCPGRYQRDRAFADGRPFRWVPRGATGPARSGRCSTTRKRCSRSARGWSGWPHHGAQNRQCRAVRTGPTRRERVAISGGPAASCSLVIRQAGGVLLLPAARRCHSR